MFKFKNFTELKTDWTPKIEYEFTEYLSYATLKVHLPCLRTFILQEFNHVQDNSLPGVLIVMGMKDMLWPCNHHCAYYQPGSCRPYQWILMVWTLRANGPDRVEGAHVSDHAVESKVGIVTDEFVSVGSSVEEGVD